MCPMVQWDRMDTRDYRVECGTEWDVPCSPICPMVQWDGMDTRDYRVEYGTEWDVPWDSGTRCTLEIIE